MAARHLERGSSIGRMFLMAWGEQGRMRGRWGRETEIEKEIKVLVLRNPDLNDRPWPVTAELKNTGLRVGGGNKQGRASVRGL